MKSPTMLQLFIVGKIDEKSNDTSTFLLSGKNVVVVVKK